MTDNTRSEVQAMLGGTREMREAVATLYVFGELEQADRAAVAGALARDADLAAMVAELQSAAGVVATVTKDSAEGASVDLVVERAIRNTSRDIRDWSVRRMTAKQPKPEVKVIRWTMPEIALVAALLAVTATVAVPVVTTLLRGGDRANESIVRADDPASPGEESPGTGQEISTRDAVAQTESGQNAPSQVGGEGANSAGGDRIARAGEAEDWPILQAQAGNAASGGAADGVYAEESELIQALASESSMKLSELESGLTELEQLRTGW